jgi:hypothetical protein
MPPQPSLHATVHLPCSHLAARPNSTRGTNSPSRFGTNVAIDHAPTLSVLRHWAAQSAQRECHVPVQPHLLPPHSSCTPARHRARNTTTPSPCAATHPHAHAPPRFAGHVTETALFPTTRRNHRRGHLPPWTQHTVPSLTAAHGSQW